jgi:hypothetical protein
MGRLTAAPTDSMQALDLVLQQGNGIVRVL